MTFTTLIDSNELAKHLDDPNWAIFDCRFDLAQPQQGERDYLNEHIPRALYLHLDQDLSSKVITHHHRKYSGSSDKEPRLTGRHPWLSVEQAALLLSDLGIDENVQVVVYDDKGGALAAARLWWTLRWLGHEAAAVLDGGWKNWKAGGFPTSNDREIRSPRKFTPKVRPELLVNSQEVEQMRQKRGYHVVDARAYERYLGEVEPIDPVAGHIPGAISAPFANNLDENGFFLPPKELKKYYKSLLKRVPASKSAFYCGSGVTSIHNLLAIMHAGMGEGRLYAGSWSEWITDKTRPVATGE
jgi:thiosulfate/3-mercaptopyruvate sulfurtransferase